MRTTVVDASAATDGESKELKSQYSAMDLLRKIAQSLLQNFRFHKRWGLSWKSERPSDCEEGPHFMELDSLEFACRNWRKLRNQDASHGYLIQEL
jgi:hypothetical protein